MEARLIRYRVQNFRSIKDSNWIETDDLGCLVGTNESGKTNILLALWKLNPANDEPIEPLIDYPRKKYHEYASTKGREIFITAEFELSDEIAGMLEEQTGWHYQLLKHVKVSRNFKGNHTIELSKNNIDSLHSNELVSIIDTAKSKLVVSPASPRL